MEKNLPVPYKSQWDADANASKDDCGPASIAMVLNYYGEHFTTDDITKMANAGPGLVSVQQMVNAIHAAGYECQYVSGGTMAHLTGYIDHGVPPIVLVHYGDLSSTEDKGFTGGHFMPVVGYRVDGSVYVNDPDFWGQFRADGDHHIYTQSDFLKAWQDSALDQNPVNSFIVILPKTKVSEDVTITGTVTAGNGNLNIRSGSTLESPIVGEETVGTSLTFDAQTVGEEVLGNNIWYKIAGVEQYVWSGRIQINATPTPPAPTPTATPEPPAVDQTALDIQRAGQVIHDALPTLLSTDGTPFGNTEGAARQMVAEWPKMVNLIIAEKKSPGLFQSVFGSLARFLGLTS